MALIDSEDRRTWSKVIKAAARAEVERITGATNVTDLPIGPEVDTAFRERLTGHLLVAFHATRLLPHEVTWIRERGLRALSRELIAERIAAAEAGGFITSEQLDQLRTANVFSERDHTVAVREGSVSLFLGRRILDEDVAGVWPLLTTWGGEGIYMSVAGSKLRPLLKTLGSPTIVKVGVDLSGSWRRHGVYPGVLNCFVGRELGLPNRGADVHYRESVPPEQVLDIWQPGHPEYDRHTELLEAI